MPLVALAVACYAAGLLAGFGGLAPEAAIAAALVVLVAAFRFDVRAAALAAVLGAGTLAATASADRAARCRGEALRERRWTAELESPAAPGAFVPATLSAARTGAMAGCAIRGAIAVEHGVAAAGARVIVLGEAVPAARGLTIQHARIAPTGARSALLAMRAAVGSHIDAIFGRDAPLVRALLIADTRSLDPALRDRFAAAGIVHMLSISGLHVAIIAEAIELLFLAARLPRAPALVATLVVTAGYVAVIGAPPPAVRSGVMLGVTMVSRLAQRPTSPWAALALGAVAPLAAPRTVLDLGWQLSVLGMASLIASGALARRWISPRLDGWRASVAAGALASVVASVASAPLVAWTFGRISLVAPITNIAASPIVAVLQPALFLAVACAPVGAVARFVAGAAHPMIVALDAIASVGASVPHGVLLVAPTLAVAVLAGIATVALLAACVNSFPARPLIAAGGALAAALWLPFAPARTGGAELHVIDVGQGDAIALRTPRGRWVVVDAG
ncbi:MAG: ComEC/Rec2 family competence protein, partial [Gemmatimonadaceae bacterium]|nr:ComEC/Rec2 family competence protein [Gemmatimonadaceae bacterium]